MCINMFVIHHSYPVSWTMYSTRAGQDIWGDWPLLFLLNANAWHFGIIGTIQRQSR